MNMYMSDVHWKVVKWILRYLNKFTRHGLLFDDKTMNDKSPLRHVHGDHGEVLDKYSTIGYASTLISAIFQNCIYLSSMYVQ